MDKIHEIDKKPWIANNVIQIKKLLSDRQTLFDRNNASLNFSGPNQDDQQQSDLAKAVDIFSKTNEKGLKPYFLFNSTEEKTLVEDDSCQLSTYKLQLEHSKRMISDRHYKVDYLMKLKTKRRELLMRHLALINRDQIQTEEQERSSIDDHETKDLEQKLMCIVVVQIYPQPVKATKIKFEKEVLFRTDQCLTDLRDEIKCQRDYGVPMDLSENPEQSERIFRGELFKSGLFLIHDTFYNDTRDSNNIDLSAPIIEWSNKKVPVVNDERQTVWVDRGIGPFKKAKMEDCKFEDLNIRLGCPYLYLHQGNCEHLFSIVDIRYVSNDVKLQKMHFPFVTATSIGQTKNNLTCYMCKNRPPHWYTRKNSRLPIDPYFFCETCFYSFNYDKDLKKIGQFQAFTYTSPLGIPDSVVMRPDKTKAT